MALGLLSGTLRRMRLQLKFALLFAVLGLTAATSVGVAVWSIRFLERELAWPLRSIQEVMGGLHGLKRAVEDQSAAIGFVRGSGASLSGGSDAFATAERREQFEAAAERMAGALERLERTDTHLMRSGVSNARNLRERVRSIREMGASWFDSNGDGDRAQLGLELGTLHELIERLEGRILDDAHLAVGHGERLQVMVLVLVAVSALAVLFEGVLAVILVRRWVVRPVESLREAARLIGVGDLSHRLEVSGSDELAELAGEMNHMAGMLDRMQNERVEQERLAAVGEMTRRIVHNLRKPLSGIRALAETTESELPANSELVPVQQRIVRAVDRFEEWLRDVLRVSSPLAVEFESVPVSEWLVRTLDAHRPEAEMRRVTIRLDAQRAPDKAEIDPRHLGHALSAVISNAIDYSPGGGEVVVEAASENDHWWIRVGDMGPGVAAGSEESIFRPFVTSRASGTGIGLAIAKRVVEQHEGSVRVIPASERPQGPTGAVFEFRLKKNGVARVGRSGGTIGQSPGH